MSASTEHGPATRTTAADGNAEPLPGIFSRRYRALSIGIVSLVALYAFEALAVATAMPTVAQALDGLPLYALAFAGTLASSVAGMVWAGHSADARGPRAPLLQGITWFVAGLIVAGLAPTMWVLLLGRVVQGYGGGLMSVALYVVVGRAYPPALRARLFAATAAAWVLPAVVGPAISGLIVEHAGWRWVFLSVPVVALAATVLVLPALRGLGPLPAVERTADGNGRRMMWAVGAAVSVLLLHFSGQRHDATAWLLLALALIGLVTCTPRLLPVGTLRAARGLPSVILLRGVAASAFFGSEVFLPLLLSRERGLSPTLAGAALTVGALGWSTGSWCRGRMVAPRPERVLRAGLVLMVLGIAGVASAVWSVVPVPAAVLGWIVAGFGMGLTSPTLSVLTLELSPPARQGINSSALQLSDALFTATVLALGGSLLARLLERAPSLAYLGGFAVTAALAMAGVLLAARTRPVG